MIFVMKIVSIVKVSANPKQKYSQRKGVQGIILFVRGQAHFSTTLLVNLISLSFPKKGMG